LTRSEQPEVAESLLDRRDRGWWAGILFGCGSRSNPLTLDGISPNAQQFGNSVEGKIRNDIGIASANSRITVNRYLDGA
jgi:hypothetical protein